MYSPTHATVGALIAVAVPDPAIGLPLALASHYLLDAVPHGDSHFGPWLAHPGARHRIIIVESLDLGAAALMVGLLIGLHPERALWYLITAAIAAILPDLLWGFRYVLENLPRQWPWLMHALHVHDRWHQWIHAKASYDISFRAGLISQGIALIAVLLLHL